MTGAVPGQGPSAYLAAVVRFAETLRVAPPEPVNTGPVSWPATSPGPDRPTAFAAELSGTWPRPRPRADDDLAPLLLAADLARARYPGPVGEVLDREIHAFIEVGHRFGRDALLTRLVRDLLEPESEGGAGRPAADRVTDGLALVSTEQR